MNGQPVNGVVRIYLLMNFAILHGCNLWYSPPNYNSNTCIPVADSFWYMAKPIQYCKVKAKLKKKMLVKKKKIIDCKSPNQI